MYPVSSRLSHIKSEITFPITKHPETIWKNLKMPLSTFREFILLTLFKIMLKAKGFMPTGIARVSSRSRWGLRSNSYLKNWKRYNPPPLTANIIFVYVSCKSLVWSLSRFHSSNPHITKLFLYLISYSLTNTWKSSCMHLISLLNYPSITSPFHLLTLTFTPSSYPLP